MKASDIKILGVTVTYNNEDKIPYVMPYYERIGIDKLIVYDNDSTDRTVELLSKYPFVEIRSYHTEQYREELVLKYKTETQNEFRGQYDWYISSDFDEVFYCERDFREMLYEKMCEGKTLFVKTGLNIFSREFPPADNGKLIHENVGRGSLWTSDDGVVGIYGNKGQLFNMKKVFVNYDQYGCHNFTPSGDVVEFDDGFAFFHLKFIDFNFILKSSVEYANRMGDNGITCYDYFTENMENVYQLMEKRAISVDYYLSHPMKELVPEQIMFLIHEGRVEEEKKIISDLKNAEEYSIERQFGILFYGNIENYKPVGEYGLSGKNKVFTMYGRSEDKIEAVKSCGWRIANNYMIRDPWICETDGELFKNPEFFETICEKLKSEALKGKRSVIIDGHMFSRYSYFTSEESETTLGCYMIVKNEEKNIKKCIDSIIDLCDTIMVVDTGCDDDTMKIVESYGSNKIQTRKYKWCDDFSLARNYAMCEIMPSCRYTFTLDADEVVSKKLHDKILELKGKKFNDLDCVDLYLLNYNGTENPSYYLGGRQIVKSVGGNHWKYKVHEKLYFQRNTFGEIPAMEGYILHHPNSNTSTGNYNKYAEWYYNDINRGEWCMRMANNNGAHYYYYLFYTLYGMDVFTAKRYLNELYKKERILSYTEDQRANLFTGNYVTLEELFAFEMINNYNDPDYTYMCKVANSFKEDFPKWLLLNEVYEKNKNSLDEAGWLNFAYISHNFGLIDKFVDATKESAEIYKYNNAIQHNANYTENVVEKVYERSLLLINCTKSCTYLPSAINYLSHMFKHIALIGNKGEINKYCHEGIKHCEIFDDTVVAIGLMNLPSTYIVDADKQISRDVVMAEYNKILYGKQSDIIKKTGDV